MCKFCPTNCKKCNSAATCIDCFPGYTNKDGSCMNLKYYQNVTWVAYEAYKDFYRSTNDLPSLFGFNLHPSGSNISTGNLNCASVTP